MCAKNHLVIFSSFLDIWENVEWPRFLDHLYASLPVETLSRAKFWWQILAESPMAGDGQDTEIE